MLSVSLLVLHSDVSKDSRAAGLALLQSDSDSQSVRNVHEEHDGGLTVAFVQCSSCSSGRCSSTAPVDTEEEPVHLCSRSQQLDDTSRAQSRTREKSVRMNNTCTTTHLRVTPAQPEAEVLLCL